MDVSTHILAVTHDEGFDLTIERVGLALNLINTASHESLVCAGCLCCVPVIVSRDRADERSRGGRQLEQLPSSQNIVIKMAMEGLTTNLGSKLFSTRHQ